MEKAILQTIIYADIFDYPLKAWEIHKWLIQKSASFQQVERSLSRLVKSEKIISKHGFYVLPNRQNLIRLRKKRELISQTHLLQIRFISQLFKVVPWVLLVGISGSLAVKNSEKNSDIDLFIVTNKNRLWISRLMLLLIISLVGLRRTRGENSREVGGKLCLNIILDIDNLDQQNSDIYIAHEVFQMQVLWQRSDAYQRFLESNLWAFKFLPNWANSGNETPTISSNKPSQIGLNFINKFWDIGELLAKKFQLWYMQKPTKNERISDNAVYFLPIDKGESVLKEYHQKIKNI